MRSRIGRGLIVKVAARRSLASQLAACARTAKRRTQTQSFPRFPPTGDVPDAFRGWTGEKAIARQLGRSLVEGTDALSVVRVHRCLAGLALRHHGPAALQSRPGVGGPQPDSGAARRHDSGRPDRRVRRLHDVDLHDRLGARGLLLRDPGRPARPRQDDDSDRSVLFSLHGLKRPLGGSLGFFLLPVSDGARRRRTVCGGRVPGRRGHVGPRPTVCPRLAASALGRGQHVRGNRQHGAGQVRGIRRNRKRLATHVSDRTGAGRAGDPDFPAVERT